MSVLEALPSMKTALHSVSYAGAWAGQVRLSLEDFLQRARDLGFEAVMLMAKRPHLSVLDVDQDVRRRIREQLERLGLQVACLAGYTDFCLGFQRPEVPLKELQILYVRELCRLAADLGCSLIRIFTGFDYPEIPADQQWTWCLASLRECCRLAAPFGVTIGVQNHHDNAVHYETLLELIQEVAEPNCKIMFDAWSHAPAEQTLGGRYRQDGADLTQAVKRLAPYLVHTTVADYVHRPRYRYVPDIVNYVRQPDSLRAVPMGEGFIDYAAFFKALKETGYTGFVAYEMCSYLRGGGSEENLDRYARKFLDYMAQF